MNATFPAPSSPPFGERAPGGLTPVEQRKTRRWVSDAFAILCVRVSGHSHAEKQLRLGFEAILRQMGTSPLHAITASPLPVYAAPTVTSFDLRLILQALDSCLALFGRYGAVLNQNQRRIEEQIRTTRAFALEELGARITRRTDSHADHPAPATTLTQPESYAVLVPA